MSAPLEPGYIKGYVPGVRENGGQYTHAAIWSVIAFAALGDGEEIWSVARLRAAIRAGKDPIETRWWVLVECADKKTQAAYLKQLELEGRTCRPVTRRHYDA